MTAPRSINFLPDRWAWLFGHTGRPRQRWLAGLALAASAGLLGLAAQGGWRAQAQRVAQGEAAQRAQQVRSIRMPPMAQAGPARPPGASAADRLGALDRTRLNKVVHQLNTPWAAVFDALEQAASPQVALLSLAFDAERGVVQVQTEGPALDALLGHAQRLQAEPRFARGRLLRIEPPEAAAAGQLSRLSFDLVLAP